MSPTTPPLLDLDPSVVRRARALARRAAAPVVKIAKSHTTVSVERATLRLAGLAGADHERVPWVNHLVDAVRAEVGLEHGVTTPVYDALLRGEAPDLLTLAQKAASGNVAFRLPTGREAAAAQRAKAYAEAAREGYWVGVAHVSFPGLGHVRANGKGYTWVPANYSALK